MKASDLKKVLGEVILKTNITPLIWGSRGIGKSQLISSLAKELEIRTDKAWGLVDLRISTQEISDLTGLPKAFTWKARDMKTGRETVITETNWSVPLWFPTLEKISQQERGIPENGIIFLDEINRGGHQETQAIFQFVLDRRIHTHSLAPGWKIAAAANPPTEEYLVNEFDISLLDRFLQLVLKPDAQDWLEWAKSREGRVAERVTRFIFTRPEMLCEISESEHSWSPPVSSSPRSWEAVSTIMENCQIPSELEAEVYAGLVGSIPAVSFTDFLKKEYERPVQALQIMKDYPRVREIVKAACEAKRIDQLNITMQDIITLARTKPTEFNMDNFFSFIMDLDSDLKVTLVHSLMEIKEIQPVLNNHEELFNEIIRIMEEVDKQTGLKEVLN